MDYFKNLGSQGWKAREIQVVEKRETADTRQQVTQGTEGGFPGDSPVPGLRDLSVASDKGQIQHSFVGRMPVVGHGISEREHQNFRGESRGPGGSKQRPLLSPSLSSLPPPVLCPPSSLLVHLSARTGLAHLTYSGTQTLWSWTHLLPLLLPEKGLVSWFFF